MSFERTISFSGFSATPILRISKRRSSDCSSEPSTGCGPERPPPGSSTSGSQDRPSCRRRACFQRSWAFVLPSHGPAPTKRWKAILPTKESPVLRFGTLCLRTTLPIPAYLIWDSLLCRKKEAYSSMKYSNPNLSHAAAPASFVEGLVFACFSFLFPGSSICLSSAVMGRSLITSPVSSLVMVTLPSR